MYTGLEKHIIHGDGGADFLGRVHYANMTVHGGIDMMDKLRILEVDASDICIRKKRIVPGA